MANGHTRPPVDQMLHRARVRQLNAAVGVTTRRLFQSPAQPEASQQQLPAQLHEFIDSLTHFESSAAVRRVFQDCEAQWLSRSAVQSGATALLCDQLLRRAERECDAKDARLELTLPLVLTLLCDQLFTSCAASSSRECVWRRRKPAYHAMRCFLIWDALLPFVERAAKRWPTALREVLDMQLLEWQQQQQKDSASGGSRTMNCKFAQVVGLWRLIETLGGSSGDVSERSEADLLALLDAILQFLVRTKVLDAVVADGAVKPGTAKRIGDEETASNDAAFYDDHLMDKFFSRLQEFLFDCPRSKHITAHALQSSIIDCIRDCVAHLDRRTVLKIDIEAAQDTPSAHSGARLGVPAGLSVFAATACVFVKDLASSIVMSVRDIVKSYQLDDSMSGFSGIDAICRDLLLFLVGFCAHVDLVPIDTVLEDRLTEEVESQDFYAMPLEWMTIFWREWFGFSNEEIISFVQGYDDHLEHRYQQQQQDFQHHQATREFLDLDAAEIGDPALVMRKALEDSLPFRNVDCVYPKQAKLLGSHFIRANFVDRILQQQEQRDAPQHSMLLELGVRTRRKRRRFIAPADPAAEERKLNVLMLSEVMERVCSFMSAKRLCRLATVCRGFAEVSRSSRLWQQLFSSLTAREIGPIVCRHGASYCHDWRTMYQERWEMRRRLRKKQRAVAARIDRTRLTNEESENAEPTAEHLTGSPGGAGALFAVQLCRVCGCNRLLTTESQLEAHMKTHELLKCSQVDCDAAFSTLSQLKKHRRQYHDEKSMDSIRSRAPRAPRIEKPRLECGFEGCTMSYTSLKRLATHRKLKNHQYAC